MADIELTGIRSRDIPNPRLDASQVGLLSSDNHDGVGNGNGHIHPENEAFLRTTIKKSPSNSAFKRSHRKWLLLAFIVVLAVIILIISLGVYYGLPDDSAVATSMWLNSTLVKTLLVTTTTTTSSPTLIKYLHIDKFQAFPEFSDSKIFEAHFNNGTTIRTYGHKRVEGDFHSLYSISIGDEKGSDLTHIYFRGHSNFASVMLPQGTIVSYEWTNGFKALECKVFSVPSPNADVNIPLSHVATLPLGEHSEIFARVTNGLLKPRIQFRTNVSLTECNARLPLRVSKCGQQYTYHGAFIQGVLTPESGASVAMEALPWPTTQDNCHDKDSEVPNYFLPLPLHTNISNDATRNQFASSGASVFINLCLSIEGSDASLDSDICTDLAMSVTENANILHDHIYHSCYKIFHSIRLTCIALKVSTSSEVTGNQFHISKQEIYQSLYDKSVTFSNLTGPRIYVTVTAFCPSVHPVSSYRQLINQSNPITLEKDMIHINCPNSPEVTRFVFGHKFIGVPSSSFSLNKIDHLLDICATCAAGVRMHVHVLQDETCCTNVCTKSDMCELGPHIPFSQNVTFHSQKDVYCEQFLTQYENDMSPVNRSCVKGCHMKFTVHFKLYKSDADEQQTYYSQKLTCNSVDSLSCKTTFGR